MRNLVLPILPAVRAFGTVQAPRPARPVFRMLLCLLGFLAVGVLPAASQRTNTNSLPVRVYQKSPALEAFEREQIRREAAENTERYRQRVELPQAAFERLPAGSLIRPGSRGADAEASASESYAGVVTTLLCVLLAAAGWFVAARKYAPELADSITSALLPRALWRPAVATGCLVMLLAEEKAVSDFQAALRSGSRAPGDADAEGSADGPTAGEGLLSRAAELVRDLRRQLEEAGRSVAGAAQRRFLVEARDQVRLLKELARPAELLPLQQMAGALEMLLKQLTEKTSNVTSSTLRTAALAVTLLEELCRPGLKPDLLSEPPLRLLVVDDETFSRFALSHALKRGLNEPDVAEHGESALALAARNPYDLIFLDVQMPGMDGFELCSKIHETGLNRATPVVFVTSQRDFDARANSILCGGRDLIAKPFLTFELTVKALTLVATERLRGRGRSADASLDETKAVRAAASLSEPARQPADAGGGAAPTPASKDLPWAPVTVPGNGGPAVRPEPLFFIEARAQISRIRELVELVRNTPGQGVQQEMITDVFIEVQMLAANAEHCGQHSIAMMASALEALLMKLLENAANLSASSLQAAATAAALIHDLCVGQPGPDLATAPPIRALVVDDDPVSLRAISNALQMKFSKPESAIDGKSALALAVERPFDVIFLDVQMPGLDGFEVCARIRENSANRRTPVVFLTGSEGAALRAQAEVCGGNDFLTKPSLSSELTLKALAFALRGRLQNAGTDRAVPPAAAGTGPGSKRITFRHKNKHKKRRRL
jgi:CheY-like chemotaxis protein